MIPRAAFILFLCSAIPAMADDAYMIAGQQFGTIDLATGVFTSAGTTEVGSTAETLRGLGEFGGVLYGAGGANDDTLYSINTGTGGLTSVGAATNIEYAGFGSTLTGLYALSTSGGFYSINPTSGVETEIGSTTVTDGGTLGLSTGSGTLYLAEFFPGEYNLYTVDTGSGALTEIGSPGSPGEPFGALLSDNGTLYGGQDAFEAVDVETLNTSTGAATFVSPLTGDAAQFDGFAPIITATTPEPTSVILLSTMLLAVAFLVRKRIAQGL